MREYKKTLRAPWYACVGFAVALFAATATWAVSVTTFSPQGEVGSQIRQIRITFSAAMVRMGNRAAAAPVTLSCALPGKGRWVDDRTWVWDIQHTFPTNQTCQATIKPGLKSATGEAVTGKRQFTFSTGQLKIDQVWPAHDQGDIDEAQVFVVQYNDAITTQKPPLFCQVEGVPERIPVVRLPAKDRDILIKHLKLEKNTAQVEAIRCAQRLPAGKKLQLSLVRSGTHTQHIDFTIRKEFKASFTCEREHAQAACIPFKGVHLAFSEAVPKRMAEKIRLMTDKGARKPTLSLDENALTVSAVHFAPPFPALSELQIVLPKDLTDDTGRTLVNAATFPLKFRIAEAPPLAKFAAAPFGIVEWNSEAAVPVTLRHVEMDLPIQSVHLGVGALTVKGDQDILRWLKKVAAYHASSMQQSVNGKKVWVQTRRLSLLNHVAGVQKLRLPSSLDKHKTRPFEVVGIPIKAPGLHVIEIESRRLGKALLGSDVPMYVRTAALVTNLGVHLKQGRDNAAVWVSTLDRAQAVADAEVNIYDCEGKHIWQGKTGKNGVANVAQALSHSACESGSEEGLEGLVVIARKKDDKGHEDVSFVRSIWNQGIESWRFPVSTLMDARPALIGHTIFDRTLFRAGETVSMKHFLRIASSAGLDLVQVGQLPTQLRIVHNGSGQEYRFPLSWRQNRYAENTLALPKDARLGTYSVMLERAGQRRHSQDAASVDADGVTIYSGAFRVEAFRLPVMTGHLTTESKVIFGGQRVPLMLSLTYSAGGPAKGLPVQVSAMLQQRYYMPAGYPDFSFWAPEKKQQEDTPQLAGKVILDKAAVILNANGNAKVESGVIPIVDRAYQLVAEATYSDPNGEIQTISRTLPIWPAALHIGLAVDSWVSVGRNMHAKVIVLDIQDKPVANQSVRMKAVRHNYLSSRKRLVGGFYAYESEETTEDLGTVCKAKTDARGLAFCDVALKQEGNIELIAEVEDSAARKVEAAQTVWVSAHDEVWFDMDNNDRIDVLAEKPEYKAGDKARFQVRMPFRKATAWVAIEREGVIETRVLELEGKHPSFDVEIQPDWAPNVFVSVLAVRGRIRDVPWYSFFTWGWKTPLDWWSAYWHEGREYEAPTAMVDLGKPAFKYGLTEIKVNNAAHRLNMTVKTDKTTYEVRKTAQVQIQVSMPDGKPAPAGTEVVFAAVDEALLELMPNKSWNLLEAMMQQRSYGVETATAQLQVVGKRHFGRKAMAPGGGAGESPTRELFNTLLVWEPKLILNAQGMATIKVPLNDTLTRFRFVAVADVGTGYFGTGSTQVTVTQDVQVSSGLPPVVREGDQLQAGITVRNGTGRAMHLTVQGRVKGMAGLSPQTLQLPAGEAREVRWPVTIPMGVNALQWYFSAIEHGGDKSQDSVSVTQSVEEAVPVTVQQASLRQLEGTVTVPLGRASDALTGRGGVNIQLQARLTSDMPAVRDWFLRYPYTCLEQRLSAALGLQDKTRWHALMQDMALYLDEDGLVNYFPMQEGQRSQGSDTLTAYILAVAHEAGWDIPAMSRAKMLRGLSMFVEGRLQRKFWTPRNDLMARKLNALEAMSRYGVASTKQLTVLDIQPQLWPTVMLIDWLSLLQRIPSIADRAEKMAQAEQLLRAKIVYQGTRLGFVNEREDYWWWLMGNSDVNAARLLLTVRQLPAWKEDLPRLLNGLLSRQQRGAWWTTNANVWGTLAVARFAQQSESGPVTGRSTLVLGSAKQTVNWTEPKPAPVLLAWPQSGKGVLRMKQEGSGKPWATIQVLMALPLKADQIAGYRIKKTITPVMQQTVGTYTRGDIVRVILEVDAQTDMTWVAVNDPIPAGASILGSGLGRDSAMATQDERSHRGAWPVYVERRFSGYQAYYRYVPRGKFTLEYTMRINNPGIFSMPPTRVEGLYAPDVFGASPNAIFKVVDAQK